MAANEYIRRRVEKERRRKEWIGQWDTPPGVSHLAGKLPRCSTKSRGNLGDYAAHRSFCVRSSWISCLGAFQPSDGSFRNYRDFRTLPKIVAVVHGFVQFTSRQFYHRSLGCSSNLIVASEPSVLPIDLSYEKYLNRVFNFILIFLKTVWKLCFTQFTIILFLHFTIILFLLY